MESLRLAIDHNDETGPAAGPVDILVPDEQADQGDRGQDRHQEVVAELDTRATTGPS